MQGYLKAAFVAVSLLVLGACAPTNVPFDRAGSGVTSVGIVTPYAAKEPTVFLGATVGRSLGLIGALVDAGMQASRESQYHRAIQETTINPPEILMAKLNEELKALGYTVVDVPVKREGQDFIKDYGKGAEPAVDAHLDVLVLQYGYMSAGIGSSSPYRPFLAVRVRLVSAKTGAVLMQDDIAYNPLNAGDRAHFITISPDPKYSYADFNTLLLQKTESVEGLRQASETTAQTVAGLMRQ